MLNLYEKPVIFVEKIKLFFQLTMKELLFEVYQFIYYIEEEWWGNELAEINLEVLFAISFTQLSLCKVSNKKFIHVLRI